MTKSEKIRRRIIWHLRHQWRWYDGGNSWISFVQLAKELGITVPVVKRETRRLARSGILFHSWMFNDDAMVSGSGYFLEPEWYLHEPNRSEDPAPDEFSLGDWL